MKGLGIVLGVGIAFVTGIFGFMAYYADFALEESYFDRLFFIFKLYIIANFIIGNITREHWKISILSSWGSVLMGGLGILAAISKGSASIAAYALVGLVILPLISLSFGYLGSIFSFKLESFFRGRFKRTS